LTPDPDSTQSFGQAEAYPTFEHLGERDDLDMVRQPGGVFVDDEIPREERPLLVPSARTNKDDRRGPRLLAADFVKDFGCPALSCL
jgi:hypothetical protein